MILSINKKIIDVIAQGLNPINPNAIIIMVSNPLDLISNHTLGKLALVGFDASLVDKINNYKNTQNLFSTGNNKGCSIF
jgi:hypothetical protein